MANSFRIGEFHQVEPSLNIVRGPAGTVRLEPKVMLVLLCLAEHGDQLVPKNRLMRAVWPDTFVTDDVLTRAISELRRVFADDVKHPRVIETIPKSGYRLIAPVRFSNANHNGGVTAQVDCGESAQSVQDGLLRVRRDKSGLWRSRVDGSEQLQLTSTLFLVLLPRWSPDGTRIAFMGRTSLQQPWKIYVVPAHGGEPQAISDDDRDESDPDWSPDGESLMFSRPPDYLAELGASKAIQVLNLRTKQVSPLPGSEGLFGSRWSHSGRYVAAISLDHMRLLLFDFSTQTWTELGRFKTLHNPVWSRDERFLYFEIVDEAGIYRLRVSDRAVERVASLRGAWASDMDRCSFEGLGPDDSPLISCFRDDRDVYALDWEMR